ncbi:MAG: CoA-transferase, partial [Rikenellaceae bacterium]
MNKLSNVENVVALLKDGMTIMVGGFLGQGSAQKVIDAICESSVKGLTVIANDASYTD